MGEHGDDVPVMKFEALDLEITKGDRFVEVGAVDALERADCRGRGVVVMECVWDWASWRNLLSFSKELLWFSCPADMKMLTLTGDMSDEPKGQWLSDLIGLICLS